jgi:hypothetical protein
MPQHGVLQYDENEPSNRGGRTPTAPQRPAVVPEAESVSKAAFLGAVKGTAMGFGAKAGKWLWEKCADLKDLFTDDGH